MNRQRAQADAAKLIATFVDGVAAAVVAAALQVGLPRTDLQWAAGLLGGGIILTVAVIVLDRISEADYKSILAETQIRGWSEERLLSELRLNNIAASGDNQKVLREVWIALLVQFTVATSSGIVAAIGMLNRA
jgi:hypothetical protein